MPASQSVADGVGDTLLQVLGIDTCGPTGTVALGLWVEGRFDLFGQKELAGRTYSTTLVSAVGDLLTEAGTRMDKVDAIVVVNGPGSFTGVRVGLSAVKGLAEPAKIPVVAVSRLAVMAGKAGVSSTALDAHRHEVFLRVAGPGVGSEARELLAGAEELASIPAPVDSIAVCEDAAGGILTQAWPMAKLVRTLAPTAADAIEMCLPMVLRGEFADVELLDGHYLRRSDAEIFGDPATAKARRP